MQIRDFIRNATVLLLLAVGLSLQAQPVSQGQTDAYKVMVLGDAHFDEKGFNPAPAKGRIGGHKRNYKMWKARSPELFAAAGKRAAAENAAFAVQLGDFVHGDCNNKMLGKMIRSGFAVLKKNFPETPLLLIKGNHDILTTKKIRNNADSNAALLPIISKELGKEVKGNSCYSFRRGADLYIAADGFIKAAELTAFVKKTLAENPDTRYVFFMTHLPLIPGSLRYPFWLLPDYREISELLAKRNTLVLAAHTHAASLATSRIADRQLTQLIVTSMGCNWEPDKVIPSKYDSWKTFAKASRKFSRPKNRYNSPEQWEILDKSDPYTFRQLFNNSGFVILDINDERVEARYYTNASEQPTETLRLLNGGK